MLCFLTGPSVLGGRKHFYEVFIVLLFMWEFSLVSDLSMALPPYDMKASL